MQGWRIMSEAYVPDHDALEQARDLESVPVPDDAGALVYPERVPPEANDADVLEQEQPLPWDDEHG